MTIQIIKAKLSLLRRWAEILLGLMIVLTANRFAFAWTTPVNISNTSGVSNYASLAVDSWGHLHVVWQDDTSGNNEVLYCFYNGDVWSTPVNLSNDSTDSEVPDITVDAYGHPHVAWTNYQSGEILWSFYDGFFWPTPVNISNNPGWSFCPSLVADDSGRVFIVWHDIVGQSDIYFSVFDGTTWSVPQNLTDDPVDSAYPDIVVDSRGHVHLVWMDYGSLDIHYSEYDGDTWTAPVNVSQLLGQSCDPRIALDSQNYPHVVWEERSGGCHVYYTYHDGETWAVSYKIATGYNPAIVYCGQTNDNHVVWGGDYEIYYSSGLDTSWSNPFIISDSPNERCLCPEISIDSASSLHVVWVYSDEQYHSDIFYSSNGLTGVEEQLEESFPQEYLLVQNYPNPFNPKTVIRLYIPGNQPTHITLKVYNLLGKEVVTLIDKEQNPGKYEVSWEGRDKEGGAVSSGVYFCRLQVGDVLATRKMVLLR